MGPVCGMSVDVEKLFAARTIFAAAISLHLIYSLQKSFCELCWESGRIVEVGQERNIIS